MCRTCDTTFRIRGKRGQKGWTMERLLIELRLQVVVYKVSGIEYELVVPGNVDDRLSSERVAAG